MVMYRGVVALIVVAACDAGTPAPVALLVVAACDAGTPAPRPPVTTIDWELGGLGTWRGQTFGGTVCRVQLELPTHRFTVTDPDGATHPPLSIVAERELLDLATAVLAEPVAPRSDSCTDRGETLRIDDHVLAQSCPIDQPGAAKLIAKLSAFCKPAP
jgi:hypothetical protein